MPNLVVDGEVHPLNLIHYALLDGFMVECPVCSKAWAHMPPIGHQGLLYALSYKKAPCPACGGSVLDMMCSHGIAMLPVRYDYAPRSLLLQIVMSVGE
jgi:hypothetical protein